MRTCSSKRSGRCTSIASRFARRRHRCMPKVVASVEARMGSSRLPGKVLMDIGGVPALTRLFRRLRACRGIDDVVLATSTAPDDEALVAWARDAGVPVFRGSEEDVLSR